MYPVETGRRGWNLDYLIRWEEKPEGSGLGGGPSPDLRIEMITGRIFDLYGEDAERVRAAIRFLMGPSSDPPLSDLQNLRGDLAPGDSAETNDVNQSIS